MKRVATTAALGAGWKTATNGTSAFRRNLHTFKEYWNGSNADISGVWNDGMGLLSATLARHRKQRFQCISWNLRFHIPETSGFISMAA